MKQRYHIIVKGKVQGVFYRQSAKNKADELGITGWTKNTPDGDVHIEAEGEESTLQQFIAWCRKGPIMAKVDTVTYTPLEPGLAPDGFAIIK